MLKICKLQLKKPLSCLDFEVGQAESKKMSDFFLLNCNDR